MCEGNGCDKTPYSHNFFIPSRMLLPLNRTKQLTVSSLSASSGTYSVPLNLVLICKYTKMVNISGVERPIIRGLIFIDLLISN